MGEEEGSGGLPGEQPISKSARKKLAKLQAREAKKAERKEAAKEERRKRAEERRREWAERIASVGTEEEKASMEESRMTARKERMEKRAGERGQRRERLLRGLKDGQRIVIDLDFSGLMTPSEINSLTQQVMYCYAVNARQTSPCHLWLTGYKGEIETHLQSLPGFDNWIVRKEPQPYIEALHDQRASLVYLTADSENILDELDAAKIYIIGGLVDRNRWKGITMNKAKDQGIQTAKLPIASYLKLSTSMVLTVNQVVEILLAFLETKDWKESFFQVIPQRKRHVVEEVDEDVEECNGETKRICTESSIKTSED